MSDYARIAKAIEFVSGHVDEQPTLAQVADHVGLSPFHLQRLFSSRAGISPKRFLQALTVERGKAVLAGGGPLTEVAEAVGLSGASRLHDHFVHLEAVTPGEYRRQGEGLVVRYGVHDSPFGRLSVGLTPRGICHIGFVDHGDDDAGVALRADWPFADIVSAPEATREVVERIFSAPSRGRPLSLHVSGTNFQVAVWRALLRIPPATAVSYAGLARALGRPRAARAIGNAVGANPVALIIPCHRVIRGCGALGGYRWGIERKRAIRAWEAARAGEGDPSGPGPG